MEYCIFYCRYGRCNRLDTCPYIHDSDKVAVCSRYIQGTCRDPMCPYSHKLTPDKMPVCSFFLQGRCNNDYCNYRHVKVSADADVCKDFVRGYCAKGEQCKRWHTFVCNEFNRDGKCPKGESCPLLHARVGRNLYNKMRKKVKQRSRKCANKDKSNDCNDSNSKGVVKDPLPSFIPLTTDTNECHQISPPLCVDSECSDNNEKSTLKKAKPIKYFWIESDDEKSDLNSDAEQNGETVCRPPIRIFPQFLFD